MTYSYGRAQGMETTIQLIAVDMDGTLLNDKKELPVDFIPWVKAHPDIRMVVASGRQYATLLADFEEIGDRMYFLSDNGALVFYKKELVHIDRIDRDIVADTLEMLEAFPEASVVLCGASSAYMQKCSPEAMRNAAMYNKKLKIVENLRSVLDLDDFVKFALFFEKDDVNEAFLRINNFNPSLVSAISGDQWMDIQKRGVNKGSGVRALQKKYHIPPEKCMAFGDYLNDCELLSVCGESYAMANAHPKLKQYAKHMTASNNEDGVMRILRMIH